MTINRADLERKVRALLAKAADRGVTAEEAIAFAEKAHTLIKEYQLEIGNDGLNKEGMSFVEAKMPTNDFEARIAFGIMTTVAFFCECRAFNGGDGITFVGFKSDIEYAVHLFRALTFHGMAGLRTYAPKSSLFLTPLQQRTDYVDGYLSRINGRLLDAVHSRWKNNDISDPETTQTLNKFKAINTELDRRGIELFSLGKQEDVEGGRDFNAGSAHGEKASFARGNVDNTASATPLIGARS